MSPTRIGLGSRQETQPAPFASDSYQRASASPTGLAALLVQWIRSVEVANAVRYGLSSAIYTRDINKAFRAIEALGSGITYVNASTIGAEVHLPFGGTRQTGSGHREGGRQVLDVFTEWKTVYIDYSGKLQRAQIDMS